MKLNGVPATSTLPEVGFSSPPRIISNVVFPDPEGPVMLTVLPGGRLREMSFRT